jgi:flagellar assembly protein FliH
LSEPTPPLGRVIRGLHPGDYSALNTPASTPWSGETKERYMEQVRERAQQMAREILAQALVEAEQIRQQARIEGFASGQDEAKALAQAEAGKVAAFLAALRDELMAEKMRIHDAHKQSLFQILRLAFEKTLGVLLDTDRERVLQALFDEAVGLLQARTSVTVHVCPADMDLAKNLLEQARQTRPDLPELCLRQAADLPMGGVRVESGDGLVDNAITARFEQVRLILDGYLEQT